MGNKMVWDKETHEKITTEKLLLLPSDRVYDELKLYGEFLKADKWSSKKELEQALRTRNDSLINLGLAQFAAEEKIVLELYQSAQDRSGSQKDYNFALRLACLSNVVAGGFIRGFLDKVDVKELMTAETEDEIATFLGNPTIPTDRLESLFSRTDEFENIEHDKWVPYIYYAARNPRLNRDGSNRHGPDMGHYSIHKAIFRLLEIAPTTMHMLRAIDDLLSRLNPDQVHHPEAIQHVLDRWKETDVKDHQGNDSEGYYTSLNLREEFRCLVGSLYGKSFKDQKINVIGSMDADDIALRCAYYGNAKMKLKEFEAAQDKDHEVFTFAALNNSSILFDRPCRKALEDSISGQFSWLYKRRCEQLHEDNKFFNPQPISETYSDDDEEKVVIKSAELLGIEGVASTQTKLEKQLSQLKGYLFWGAVIVLIAIAHYAR